MMKKSQCPINADKRQDKLSGVSIQYKGASIQEEDSITPRIICQKNRLKTPPTLLILLAI